MSCTFYCVEYYNKITWILFLLTGILCSLNYFTFLLSFTYVQYVLVNIVWYMSIVYIQTKVNLNS